MKKLISLVAAAVLILAAAPTVFAAETEWSPASSGDFSYTDEGWLVIKGAANLNANSKYAYAMTGDFDLEFELLLPKSPAGTDCKFAVGVGCVGGGWVSGLMLRIFKYQSGTIAEAAVNDGTDGSFFQSESDIIPDIKLGDDEWNTIRIERRGDTYNFMINGVCFASMEPRVLGGSGLYIGANLYSSASGTVWPAFTVKNMKITVDGSEYGYFPTASGNPATPPTFPATSSDVTSQAASNPASSQGAPSGSGCGNKA